MAKLFDDIDELKKFVSVTRAMKIESIAPKIDHALKKYIEPWLGPVLTTAIVAAHAGGSPTAIEQSLIDKIQPCLANFAWLEYIPMASVVVDDSGINRKENENWKSAHSGQISDLKADAIESAYDNLEYLLQFLEDNENDYPTWVAFTEGYTKNKEFFINTAKELMLHYPIVQGRQTYHALRPILEDVECFTILPCIGQDFFDYLKSKIALKQAFTNPELEAVKLIRKAVAQFAIHDASKSSWVKFNSQGVMYIERKGSETNVTEQKTAKNEQISVKIRQAWEKGNMWLSKLKELLDGNLDDYPAYRDDPVINPPEDDENCDNTPDPSERTTYNF